MPKTTMMVAILLAVAGARAEGPNEWYVDCHAAEGGDGSSASPFKNIPIAVTNAAAGDTIWVRPGVYDSGEMSGQKGGKVDQGTAYVQRSRVTLTKQLFLKSTDGREVTHIVGDQGADRMAYTNDTDGSKTVQCVWIGDKAAGSVVEGFTLRDGAACINSSGGGAICSGSSIATSPTGRFVVAYCTISNCVSKYGAMLHGFAVGTSFLKCHGTNGGAAYDIAACNCIVSECAGSTALYRCGPLVNCTIVNTDGSRGTQISESKTSSYAKDGGVGSYYNCAIFANGKGDGDEWSIYRTCYTDASTSSNLSENTTYVYHGSNTKEEAAKWGYEKTMMSSVGGDFRPVKDGKLDGKGDATYLTLEAIPVEYQSRDFFGKPIESGTSIPIGVILPAAVPATAGARLNNTLKLNGRAAAVRYQYHYTDAWPAMMKVEGLESQADTFLGAYADAYDTASAYTKYKGQYEHVWLMLPPLVNTNGDDLAVFTFGSRVAATTLWVDCNADYEGAADGTSERPYRTIQDAVNVLEEKVYSLINVRKGVYNQGTGTEWDAAFKKDFVARVAVPNLRYVLIRAVDGPEETVIEGAPDPNPPEPEAYPGCGPNVCFGLAVPGSCTFGISGFTFRKCYANNGTTEVSGAAIRGSGQNQHAYDCVFTDCHAGESGSACVNNIWAVRCLFTNNTASARGVCINGSASACLFVDNATADSSTCPFYNSQHAYGCTVYDPKASSACNVFNTNDKMIGNVFVTVGKFSSEAATGVYAGNVASDVLSVFSAVRDDQFVRENPFVAAPARLDCRVATNSPAIGANGGLLTERIAAGERMRYLGSDYYNNPSFAADGRFIAGAVATTYEPSMVYVDAAAGDDAKDGKTEETAMKTFAGVFAGAYCAGDTVVALPGTYATGTMDYRRYVVSASYPTHSVKSRVVVPSGCTLVSRDGAAVTTIVGAADPEPTELGEEYGLGPNAVRCVFLDEGATIRGFTLKDGRTDCAETGYYDDVYGGGVLGRSIESVRVVDCVITNCYAENGGGVGYATMDRCRVLGCYARRFGSVGRFVSAFNTYSDECFGPYAYAVYNELVNCTVGSRCVNKSGTATLPFHSPNLAGSKVWNCLYCGQESSAAIEFYKTDDKTGAVTVYTDVQSSVFPKGTKFIILDEYADNVITNAVWGDIKRAYADGKPTSAEAPGVDLGTANDLMGETDRDGLQRVMNARVDVGCCEYDWRTDYAKSMGKPGVIVTEVTPGVVMTDGHAVMSDGDALALDCPTGKVGKARVVLDGTGGTLKAYLNGRLIGTLTESGELKIESELDVDRLAFVYEGRTGSAYVAKLSSGLGGLLILR